MARSIKIVSCPDLVQAGQIFDVHIEAEGFPVGSIDLELVRDTPAEGPWQIAVAITGNGSGTGTFRKVTLRAVGTATLACRCASHGGVPDARPVEVCR